MPYHVVDHVKICNSGTAEAACRNLFLYIKKTFKALGYLKLSKNLLTCRSLIMFREGVFLSLWEANRITEWGTEALKKCIFSLYPKGVDVWILVPMGIWNEIKKRNVDQNHVLSLIYRKALDMFDELLHRNDVFLTEKSIARHFPFMSHTWSIML